jgi:hypothetical protein
MMTKDEARYHSFLLRLWQAEQNGQYTWRCSLEETGMGWRHNFASLEDLMAHLLAISHFSDQPATGSGVVGSAAPDLGQASVETEESS